MKKISILGSTGSIGISALDVIGKNPEKFKIVALAAGQNILLMKKQIEKFNPEIVAVRNKENALKLRQSISLKNKVRVFYGEEGFREVASIKDADIVVSAISGFAGLLPTIAAIEAGKDIALANKETMVVAGEIVTQKAKKKGVDIIPVDSEHSAIFQCLQGHGKENLRRIILTASGGPFLNYTRNQLKEVTLKQALKHPNWKMGKRITIDSASMMNKGLEIIEARWLFGVGIESIDVLIHPQSIVHSMVEFIDGSLLAQLGVPDMKVPIALSLTYPDRISNDLPFLNLPREANLEFHKPDMKKFPCLELAYTAGLNGGTFPAVLNAADEIAVSSFIGGEIGFTDIPKVIRKILTGHRSISRPSLEDILQTDLWARRETKTIIERMKH